MKKIFFICIISLCATTVQTKAQLRDTTLNKNNHKVDADFLLQKSKKQKTAAWIMLGGGTITGLVGSLVAARGLFDFLMLQPDDADKKIGLAGILIITGGAAMFGSIPFFIASGKNKRKANLMLKNETVSFNPQLNIKGHLISLGVKVNL